MKEILVCELEMVDIFVSKSDDVIWLTTRTKAGNIVSREGVDRSKAEIISKAILKLEEDVYNKELSDAIHDCLVEIGIDSSQSLIERTIVALPKDIILEVERWGASDTAVIESIYKQLNENM